MKARRFLSLGLALACVTLSHVETAKAELAHRSSDEIASQDVSADVGHPALAKVDEAAPVLAGAEARTTDLGTDQLRWGVAAVSGDEVAQLGDVRIARHLRPYGHVLNELLTPLQIRERGESKRTLTVFDSRTSSIGSHSRSGIERDKSDAFLNAARNRVLNC